MWVCTCVFVCLHACVSEHDQKFNYMRRILIYMKKTPRKESCDLCFFKTTKLFLEYDFVARPGIANRSEFMKYNFELT